MSITAGIILAMAVVWALWLILSLRRKLKNVNVELSAYKSERHACKSAKLRLTGNRLNVYCECGNCIGMFLCIPVGPESEVEYGPEVETSIDSLGE